MKVKAFTAKNETRFQVIAALLYIGRDIRAQFVCSIKR